MWGYKAMFGYRRAGRPGAAEWDGMAQEQIGVSVGLEGTEWIEITSEEVPVEEQIGVSVGLEGITWEEVEEEE